MVQLKYKTMSRKIIIDKYQGNTHYSVNVMDSFGQKHYLGCYLLPPVVDKEAQEIWDNEVKREVSPLSKAIKECIEIDRKAGITSGNRDGLD
tara:strand:+ start:477 stop:752 length:276 start_codon:yes stop_codon:yes gene_type:complete